MSARPLRSAIAAMSQAIGASPDARIRATGQFNRLVLLSLLLLTVLVYSNSFAGVWQFDDFAVLLADPRVQSFSAWWQAFPHIRPLFKLTVALNHELGWGLTGFHALNLAVHLGNTVLVYRLSLQLLAQCVANDALVALLVAAVFALHPAQTEAVTYLSGRSVALEAMGLLLAALAALKAQQTARHIWWWLAGLALLFALGCRETAIIAPLLLWWLWRYQQQHSAANLPQSALAIAARPPAWTTFIGAMSLLVLLLLVVLALPRYRELIGFALHWSSSPELLATQTQSISYLLAVAVEWRPVNADPVLTVAPLASITGVTTLLGFAAVLLLGWRYRATRPLLWFAIGWLLIIWLPSHSLLLRRDPANDRQLYLALPALVWAVIALIPPRWQRAAPLGLLSVLVVTQLAWSTWQRNAVYQSERRFWQDVVSKAPDNARGWNNLGIAYAVEGDPAAAEAAFSRALKVQPTYLRAAVNLKLLRSGGNLVRTTRQP